METSKRGPDRYKICSSEKKSELEAEVNALMREGWRPLEGVVATHYEAARMSHFRFTQAMIKEEPSPSTTIERRSPFDA